MSIARWTAEHYQELQTQVQQALWAGLDKQCLFRAVLLVLDDAITPHADGTAEVRSCTGGKSYHCNGTCTCPAYAHGMLLCKHRIGAQLYKRTHNAVHARQQVWQALRIRDAQHAAFVTAMRAAPVVTTAAPWEED